MKHILLISASALLLTSCANSNWNPDGYRWHDNSSLTSPAQTSGWNNKLEGQPLDRTQSLESVMAGVSADIADSLETRLSRATPIYLTPKTDINAFTSLLDHNLRGKLSERGFSLSSTPVGSYALSYDVYPTQVKDAPPSTYDITIWDMGGEEPAVIETRIQELPTSARAKYSNL